MKPFTCMLKKEGLDGVNVLRPIKTRTRDHVEDECRDVSYS